MGVERNSPKIADLRKLVEQKFGRALHVHYDFVELADKIWEELKTRISEITIQRVWGYSTRGYSTVSLHTLNLLSQYVGHRNWPEFEEWLKENRWRDSDWFTEEAVYSDELEPGDRLQIGWLPDRLCVIEYLGNNRYVARECENSTMKKGDTFSCLEFMKNQPAIMTMFVSADDNSGKQKRYVAGSRNGLSLIKKL